MSEFTILELLYSTWEFFKLVGILCIFVTLLQIRQELRDLKAGDLREKRRLARQPPDKHANEL